MGERDGSNLEGSFRSALEVELKKNRKIKDIAGALMKNNSLNSNQTSPTRVSVTGPPHFRNFKRMLHANKLTPDKSQQDQTLSTVLKKSAAATVLLRTCLEMSNNQTDHQKLVEILIQSASKLLGADRCTFFLVEGEELVSRMAEGTSEIRLPIGGGIAGTVARTGTVINLPDAYMDSRFNQDIDRKTGYKTKALLCAPVFYKQSVIAVAQLLNKTTDGRDYFDEEDESTFQAFSLFAGVFLQNSYMFRQIEMEKRKNEILLDVVQRVNETDLGSWVGVCDVIVEGCTELLQAERCTLFIVNKENGTLLANSGGTEICMPLDQGIAGFVCSSGETVNIPDAYCDPRFNPDVDAATGFVTRTILCMPVIASGETVAVAQVINKMCGEFTDDDEELLRFFSAFSGLHLANSKLMEFCQHSRDSAMKLLQSSSGIADPAETSKIIAVSDDDAAKALSVIVSEEEYQLVQTEDFNVHSYVQKSESYSKLIPLAVFLFDQMGFLEEFKISRLKLAKFLLTTSQKYRAVPYHNFVHAFDVLQTIFTYVTVFGCGRLLRHLDIFVLFVSAVMHDVDHMGLNNSFHSRSETPLGLLSNASGASSVLEVHHCNVAIAILGTPGLELFSELSKEDSVWAYKLLINSILNTDMARHKDSAISYKELPRMVEPPIDEDHRKLLCTILLKAGDLSNLTKPFNISRLWGIAITTEFYIQGDSERAAGKSVTPGFDRTTKQELAQGQIAFIRGVALDFFASVAAGVFSGFEPIHLQLQGNLAKWESIANQSNPHRSSLNN
eukprot:TRINITY_DN16351_c0_g1_i2.p1 TRINITY_DN16351_c0_g1~~TRINITY_DN16351_c0_g1_i2.p1  ORF type:complete len:864 (+),score=309.96 TRINITY_DN16351_c0_g1_i2:239-2593(+)